jgi:hypothetical protein
MSKSKRNKKRTRLFQHSFVLLNFSKNYFSLFSGSAIDLKTNADLKKENFQEFTIKLTGIRVIFNFMFRFLFFHLAACPKSFQTFQFFFFTKQQTIHPSNMSIRLRSKPI